MSGRTALLIRCSQMEGTIIRTEAKAERRTVNNYVLNIVLNAVQIEEKLERVSAIRKLDRTPYFAPKTEAALRTAILVRCSVAEANRIRAAARQRGTTISKYVLHTLRRSWNVKSRLFSQRAATSSR